MVLNNFCVHDHIRETLSARELFDSLPSEPRRKLDLIERRVAIIKDRSVFSPGARPSDIYIHRRGLAAITCRGCGDRSDTIHATSGQIYGVVEILSDNSFEIGMRTITDSDFDLISRDEFLEFVLSEPVLALKLAQVLSCLYQNAIDKIRSHQRRL